MIVLHGENMSSLPKTSGSVNTDLLHPELVRRAKRLVELLPGLKVVSGARSAGWPSTPGRPAPAGSQWWLWERFAGVNGVRKVRGAPMAANPIRAWSGGGGRGSRHQTQSDGYAHAIDWRKPRNLSWEEVHKVAKTVGLGFPLADHPTHPEPWHSVAAVKGSLHNWLPAPKLGGRKAHKGLLDGAFVAAGKALSSGATIVKLGSEGFAVALVQCRLAEHGMTTRGNPMQRTHVERATRITSVCDRRTVRAIRRFQRTKGLKVDGKVGRLTWRVLREDP